MEAFKIKIKGKILDYRLGAVLDLSDVRDFFEKKYVVNSLWSAGRHILGQVEKDNKILFLKLATTEGISAVTETEYRWNEQFNTLAPRRFSRFWVPQNYDSGYYKNNLFYLVTDKFDGEQLSERPGKLMISQVFKNSIPEIIAFSEFIQDSPIQQVNIQEKFDYKEWFLNKTKSWYKGIPENIREQYHVDDLLKIVEKGLFNIQKKARHGDFTPWHLMRLKTGELGLIDGEHAMSAGVQYYDIAYFIQRIFNELQNPKLAQEIIELLLTKNYNMKKLKVVLAARGIGGFLDDSLKPQQNYTFSDKYREWIVDL